MSRPSPDERIQRLRRELIRSDTLLDFLSLEVSDLEGEALFRVAEIVHEKIAELGAPFVVGLDDGAVSVEPWTTMEFTVSFPVSPGLNGFRCWSVAASWIGSGNDAEVEVFDRAADRTLITRTPLAHLHPRTKILHLFGRAGVARIRVANNYGSTLRSLSVSFEGMFERLQEEGEVCPRCGGREEHKEWCVLMRAARVRRPRQAR